MLADMPAIRPPRPIRPRRPGRPSRPRRRGAATAGQPRIVVLGDLVLDVVVAPERGDRARHRRHRPRVDRPGRIGRHDRPLARPARGAQQPHRRDRTGLRGTSPRQGARGRTASRCASSGSPARRRAASAWSSPSGGGERSFVTDRGAALRLGPDGPEAGLVRRRGPAPPDRLFPAGFAAGRVGPAGDRARSRGGCAGEPGPGLDRSAPGGWPSGGPGPHRRDRPGRPVRHGHRGRGPAGRPTGHGAAPTTPRWPSSSAGRWARPCLPGPRPNPSASKSRPRAWRRPTRPAPAMPSMPGSSPRGSGHPRSGRSLPASLHRAALAGHRAAGRQLSTPRPELVLG